MIQLQMNSKNQIHQFQLKKHLPMKYIVQFLHWYIGQVGSGLAQLQLIVRIFDYTIVLSQFGVGRCSLDLHFV